MLNKKHLKNETLANFLFGEWILSRILVDWIRRRSSRNQRTLGYLLHYQSHVDGRYKQSLLKTMLNRAFKLSSTWQLFHQECERLKKTFFYLALPVLSWTVDHPAIYWCESVGESKCWVARILYWERSSSKNRFVMQRSDCNKLSAKTS